MKCKKKTLRLISFLLSNRSKVRKQRSSYSDFEAGASFWSVAISRTIWTHVGGNSYYDIREWCLHSAETPRKGAQCIVLDYSKYILNQIECVLSLQLIILINKNYTFLKIFTFYYMQYDFMYILECSTKLDANLKTRAKCYRLLIVYSLSYLCISDNFQGEPISANSNLF